MKEVTDLFKNQREPSNSTLPTPTIGRLVRLDEKGNAKIDYPGNTLGALSAKTTITLPPNQAKEGQPLLLLFENNEADKPIIIGLVGESLVPNAQQSVTLPVGRPEGALVDGKRITLDGREEILLQCGKSSILLRKDGKVVVKGREILSRASGANKIKGATISIN